MLGRAREEKEEEEEKKEAGKDIGVGKKNPERIWSDPVEQQMEKIGVLLVKKKQKIILKRSR